MQVLYTPQEYLQLSADQQLLLISFKATWCHVCHLLQPKIESLAGSFPQVAFAAVDVEDAVELADSFGIQQLPTLVLIRGGREVHRITSFAHKRPTRAVSQAIRQHLLCEAEETDLPS